MISPALEYLLARMDDLDELHRDESALAWADSELQPFVREVFAHIGWILKMQEIADRYRRHRALDLDALASGVETAKQLLKPTDGRSQVASGIDPNELLQNLEQNLKDLRELTADPSATMRNSARISRMDWAFMRAAVYLLAQREVPLALRDRVLEKIRLLPAADVALLWAWINQELQGEDGLAADLQEPTGFETFPDLDSAKGLIATYIAIEKPRLLRERAQRGLTNYPLEVPGVAQVLSWVAPGAVERGSVAEDTFVQALVQTAMLARAAFDFKAEDLAADLQLTDANVLRDIDTFHTEVRQPALSRRLRFQLRKLIRSADLLVTRDAPLMRHLRQYKLGLEILATEHAKEYSEKHETLLQKELCRFLIERNVMAVGTKFGSHETDLVTTEGGVQWVIEAKRIKGAPTPAKIDRAMGQLRTYLDDHLGEVPFGILALYNFTDCWMSAPVERIGGQIQIVTINLNKTPVSTRKRSIAIEPGEDGKLIRLVETGAEPRKVARRGRRKKK